MSWITVIFVLCFTFIHPSEADPGKKVPSPSPPPSPSAVVVGTVFCDTCFQEDFSKTSHFISGATVVVECGDGFQKEAKTNKHGVFKVHLPFSVSKHVRKIKGCSVRLIRSSEPYCSVASAATSSSLRLKSRKQGLHIFSAGFFTFKPLKQPYLCNQKPMGKGLSSVKSVFPPGDPGQFPPPLQTPDLPPENQYYFPPVPFLPMLPPLPQLPPLPPLPGLPHFPPKPHSKRPQLLNKKSALPEFLLPPLIPSPPASIVTLPLNPFQPPPLLPPNPFQPPAPLINLPPIASLIPSPPPPAFPFPFPPFPFPPPPRFPGIPSAASSAKKGSP